MTNATTTAFGPGSGGEEKQRITAPALGRSWRQVAPRALALYTDPEKGISYLRAYRAVSADAKEVPFRIGDGGIERA